MKMKTNEKRYGFFINKATEVPEIKATLFEGEHEKSGAKLLFLDREDENKTFSITFKTTPEDSTGVFHIIEHSVLGGSRKYTAKEPFVELLKSSLNTFLNAMTFPDKTMYPVASRNDTDFSNLVSVYLDGVLHPAILTKKNVFLQEGWHYAYDKESGEISRTGVVLNEMKGAFSSPDEVASFHLNEMLYPDTCYKYESGGEPSHVTNLCYEDFVKMHEKYYHPSNSEIFLDGSVDLDSILPLIDSYLCEYDRKECKIEIPDQPRISPTEREIEYEIAPNESVENKARMAIGFLSTRYDEQKKNVATAILLDAIASSNETPLKKPIIDSGLCEDVDFIPLDSIKQNAITVDFKNIADGKIDELSELFYRTARKIYDEGIDKKTLFASLDSLEFRMKEKDYGTMPIGIIYAMTTLESSLYGGSPAQNLSYEESFAALRKEIEGRYFEELLAELFLNNKHKATLIMKPSATLGEERAEKEREEMERFKTSLTKRELDELIAENEALISWQNTPDTPEQLATIPSLKISDVPKEVEKIPREEKEIDGVTVLHHELATNGIIYADLYFDTSDLTPKEIFDLRILISLTENVNTEKRSAIELQNVMKSELGSFGISMTPLSKKGRETRIFTTVSASFLESKKESALSLIPEILYTSVYKNKEIIHNILRQLKMASEESFVSSGHLAAFRRATAYVNRESAILEYYSGYEAHKSIKQLDENFDNEFERLADRLSALAKRIFTVERLTISITAPADHAFEKKLISCIRGGEKAPEASDIPPLGKRNEGIIIPAQASYAAMASNVYLIGEELCGSINVARSLLSYGYLWNSVRVQGGAYGVGLIARNNGNVGFYSYRDPSPERTLSCYRGTSSALREFARGDEDITKFIIGAVGDASPLTTPKLKSALSATRYLRGVSYEDECRVRREMLEVDKAELLRIADVIDKIVATDAICIVAGKDKLDSCKELDTLLEI